MRGRKIEEIEGSSRGIYIRNTADITPKWKNMCSIADTPELGAISAKNFGSAIRGLACNIFFRGELLQ